MSARERRVRAVVEKRSILRRQSGSSPLFAHLVHAFTLTTTKKTFKLVFTEKPFWFSHSSGQLLNRFALEACSINHIELHFPV
jgi:hypothetical protein